MNPPHEHSKPNPMRTERTGAAVPAGQFTSSCPASPRCGRSTLQPAAVGGGER